MSDGMMKTVKKEKRQGTWTLKRTPVAHPKPDPISPLFNNSFQTMLHFYDPKKRDPTIDPIDYDTVLFGMEVKTRKEAFKTLRRPKIRKGDWQRQPTNPVYSL